MTRIIVSVKSKSLPLNLSNHKEGKVKHYIKDSHLWLASASRGEYTAQKASDLFSQATKTDHVQKTHH